MLHVEQFTYLYLYLCTYIYSSLLARLELCGCCLRASVALEMLWLSVEHRPGAWSTSGERVSRKAL
jgi:hypothetical protein